MRFLAYAKNINLLSCKAVLQVYDCMGFAVCQTEIAISQKRICNPIRRNHYVSILLFITILFVVGSWYTVYNRA